MLKQFLAAGLMVLAMTACGTREMPEAVPPPRRRLRKGRME